MKFPKIPHEPVREIKIKRGSTKHQEHQGPSGWKLRQSSQLGRAMGLALKTRRGTK